MDFPTYIFCEWEGRFWPAKVVTKVKQPLSKSSKLQVEIIEENKQTSVMYSDTKPFLIAELQKMSEGLDRSKNLQVTVDEVKYRSALRTAMNLLSVRETEASQDAHDATCSEVEVKGESECMSLRKNLLHKDTVDSFAMDEASDSTMEDKDRTILSKRKYLRATRHSVSLKTSNEPNIQKHVKDMDNGRKRRAEDKKQSKLGGKKSAPKNVSPHNSSTEEHTSEKGKNKRGKCKSSLCSAEGIQDVGLPVADEDDTSRGNKRPKKLKAEPTKKHNLQVASTLQPITSDTEESDCLRKRKYNQLPLPDFSFVETDLLSSELSMECSSPESSTTPKVWPNDDTEEDVQLPVIKLKKEPASFERGAFVWCKFQRYPYWPSLVKLVRNKEKRASIIFVEECLSDPNSQKKSFQVSFRTLKHYDCQEKQELLDIARKDYGKSVEWCDALICDYRIRLGCGSFSGSFLEYCTLDISYPVRKECCKTKLNFPSMCAEICDSVPDIKDNDSCVKKKVLPDRARASRDKANGKLVDCIVKAKRAEPHLKGILTGKKKSHWLKKFQLSKQRVECLETYIEDEKQTEMVVGYLQMLCDNMSKQSKKLMNGDQTKFILEVLFPEAVIFAISATDGLSYEKAEKKFLEGPLLSKRERKQFEKQILDKKRLKAEENL